MPAMPSSSSAAAAAVSFRVSSCGDLYDEGDEDEGSWVVVEEDERGSSDMRDISTAVSSSLLLLLRGRVLLL